MFAGASDGSQHAPAALPGGVDLRVCAPVTPPPSMSASREAPQSSKLRGGGDPQGDMDGGANKRTWRRVGGGVRVGPANVRGAF
jgi:hypothetical protein